MHYTFRTLGQQLVERNRGRIGDCNIDGILSRQVHDVHLLSVAVYIAETLKNIEKEINKDNPEDKISDGMLNGLLRLRGGMLPPLNLLSTRAKKVIRSAGITYRHECTATRLLSVKGCGITTFGEIRRWLRNN